MYWRRLSHAIVFVFIKLIWPRQAFLLKKASTLQHQVDREGFEPPKPIKATDLQSVRFTNLHIYPEILAYIVFDIEALPPQQFCRNCRPSVCQRSSSIYTPRGTPTQRSYTPCWTCLQEHPVEVSLAQNRYIYIQEGTTMGLVIPSTVALCYYFSC